MKNLIAAKSVFVIAATLMTSFTAPTPVQAGLFGASEIRQWNVCDWEKIPDNVMQRITKRADFDDILRRMFDSCPDSALAFTDQPTASVEAADNGRSGTRDGGRANERDGDDTGDRDGPSNDDSDDDSSDEQDFGLPG
ncbi:MAG: hypothetical protein ABJL72_07400 [Roseobacter sp.]